MLPKKKSLAIQSYSQKKVSEKSVRTQGGHQDVRRFEGRQSWVGGKKKRCKITIEQPKERFLDGN